MTLCIVGINAFQGYWLWTTYQLNRQQFSRSVQDALFHVLEQRQIAEARRLVGKKLLGYSVRQPTASGASSRIIVRRYSESGPMAGDDRKTHIFVNERIPKSGTDSASRQLVVTYKAVRTPSAVAAAPADSLAHRISSLLLLDWATGAEVNLARLASAYRTELQRRKINTDFQLDTLTIKPQQTDGNVVIFRSLSARQTDKTSTILRTTPEPINPVKNLFVQASFNTPTVYLLRQMGWLLGSSALLLILTTGCFLFMLTTILRQKKLSAVKNDFINNMTHELKTPIATVTAAVDALQHFGALNDPQKTQTYLTISRNNLQRLADLVEKVLNLAVDEKRDFVLHPEPVTLAALVEELLTNHQLRAAKPVHFTLHIPPETVVTVDRIHFSNALDNLIDNAIKYSQDQVTISIVARQQDRQWQLTITDNGTGIPKAYQSAIFDRFFRVPTGDLHPVKGFGLGLAYVRQVVERHGGTIRVHSEPGKGSVFTIDF
ncbi:HAMP domain-containing sensor histidine kinase [Spirosoma koreense]